METKMMLNKILDLNLHNVLYFKMIMEEQNLSPNRVVIVVANSDDIYGRKLAKLVLPGFNWQKFKEQGGEPLALGLASKHKVKNEIKKINPQIARDLELVDKTPVVVVDKETAEIFSL